ncbi:GntR family transcriptional regulator [Pseudaminobacter arsenicus]|uniref:GntR family transcriptional regulator n=2 Tax=Borborobacter arsenicus TaxID=1851146 RepID=A0A432V7Z4_9HYPH|nr:GntR family transcriptional regulator [Pseudaminobacter arsenicus]
MHAQNLVDQNAIIESSSTALLPTEEQSVVDLILKAILEQRIAPGTKLGEEALANIFGVSRTRIRRVLLSLSHRYVVELRPNRGAIVASPSEQEARNIFEARRAIELAIAKGLAKQIGRSELAELRKHVRAEADARKRADSREAIRLSGEFHLLLARLAGSKTLSGILETLVSQTSLIIGLYGHRHGSSCAYEDHEEIINALNSKDPQKASALMLDHLEKIESTLDLTPEPTMSQDLHSIFGQIAAKD